MPHDSVSKTGTKSQGEEDRAIQKRRACSKALVVIIDSDGDVGLDVKCAKEAATAIRGAIIHAKPAGGLESWPPASPRRCCSSPGSMMSSLPRVDPPRYKLTLPISILCDALVIGTYCQYKFACIMCA